ncbi:MAG: type 1 glutamine amidotransferase-like domain-containing protein [Okeania sp. SIO2G4]|nr:type 1 glutamine amidotransferase-like domain-containing protein [Okeania sp. SIO2H7]NEP73709.1 type 1 glutamine amidotransferase-like domain-containing protein [Okeania sp. SIO2G5]NEP97018.1 type 1 glutamine amidotransferase-like domain-containing protein [Okeania sp. SIO2F5]NEQ92131.1 type 1 glutamine amidotransferase-like domain-containing protein [Okeania sp. SIO2G4]
MKFISLSYLFLLLTSLSRKLLKVIVMFCLIITIALIFPTQAKSDSYLENSINLSLMYSGPVYNFGGGGLDIDSAIQWMINQVRGCNSCRKKVDVIVIRDSGSDAYNRPILDMDGVDSVETLIISHREDAQKEKIINQIENAEVIFFAGGDQCQYLRNYRNTEVDKAVNSVIAKGGAVGGTSAGAMIQSNFVFNACSETVTSKTALNDPYEDISLDEGLFYRQKFQGTVIDTHFYERDRMGRLMTFVARLLRDGISDTALGIGIDEDTSLIVDKSGLAEVVGNGFVYFVLGDHLPEECNPQIPLTFSGFKIWKKGNGETFDLNHRPSIADYQVSVENGELDSSPY